MELSEREAPGPACRLAEVAAGRGVCLPGRHVCQGQRVLCGWGPEEGEVDGERPEPE